MSEVKRWIAPGWEAMQAREVVRAEDYDALVIERDAALAKAERIATAKAKEWLRVVGERNRAEADRDRLKAVFSEVSLNLLGSRALPHFLHMKMTAALAGVGVTDHAYCSLPGCCAPLDHKRHGYGCCVERRKSHEHLYMAHYQERYCVNGTASGPNRRKKK